MVDMGVSLVEKVQEQGLVFLDTAPAGDERVGDAPIGGCSLYRGRRSDDAICRDLPGIDLERTALEGLFLRAFVKLKGERDELEGLWL